MVDGKYFSAARQTANYDKYQFTWEKSKINGNDNNVYTGFTWIIVWFYCRQIKYSPSILQLIVYTMTSIVDMATALRAVPRLFKTFKIKNICLVPFSYSIVNDPVSYRVQMQINQGTFDSAPYFSFKFLTFGDTKIRTCLIKRICFYFCKSIGTLLH